MGSPNSAVVANMVMEDVEQRALATSPVKPFFWKRYVDDVISASSGGAPPIAFKFSRAVYHLHSIRRLRRGIMFLMSWRQMAIKKPFSVTAKNQLQLVALLMKGNQRLILLLLLTFRVLRNPSREFWIATTLKLLKNLFRLWGIFSPNLTILSRKNNEPTPLILFLAMTVTTNTSDRPNVSLVHRLKDHQKAVFFCKKESSALSEHTCLTNHTVGWDNSKIITTNRCYHLRLCLEAWHINSAHAPLNRDDGGSLPDAYLHLVRKKAAY